MTNLDSCLVGINSAISLNTNLKKESEEKIAGFSKPIAEIEARLESYNKIIAACNYAMGQGEEALKLFEATINKGCQAAWGSKTSFAFKKKKNSKGEFIGMWPVMKVGGIIFEDIGSDLGDGMLAGISFLAQLSAVIASPSAPKILLADEPCSEIDIKAWKSLSKYLEYLYKEHNLQIIMTTHLSNPPGTIYLVEKVNGNAKITKE